MAAVHDPQQRSTPGPSQTQTETTNSQSRTGTQAILRLRGAHAPSRPSVRWAEDVVDNEGLGRKSSKVCCIYHRPKGVDESSDESSSDSSSDSDSDSDDGGRRRIPSADHKGKGKGKDKSKKDHDCDDHEHSHDGHRHGRNGGRDGKPKRRPSPNAYERVPKPPKPKDEGADASKEPKSKP